MDGCGRGDQRNRHPRTTAQEGRHGERAKREREHAWMEVRLERVGACFGNAVAKRERRAEHDQCPWTSIDTQGDRCQPGPHQRQRDEIATRYSVSSEVPVVRTSVARISSVAMRCPCASIRDASRGNSVGSIDLHDDGNVEGLVGDPVPVACTVCRGHEPEREPEDDEQRRCDHSRAGHGLKKAAIRLGPSDLRTPVHRRLGRRWTAPARQAAGDTPTTGRDGESDGSGPTNVAPRPSASSRAASRSASASRSP